MVGPAPMASHLLLASGTTTPTDFVGRHGAYAIFIVMRSTPSSRSAAS
jgi:hypothetical protein